MAIECLCIPYVTDLVCEHFNYYAELRLHVTCPAILHSNEVRRNWHHVWWDQLRRRFGSPDNKPRKQKSYVNEAGKWFHVTQPTVAHHNSIMGGKEEKWQQMPGDTVEAKWIFLSIVLLNTALSKASCSLQMKRFENYDLFSKSGVPVPQASLVAPPKKN